MYSDCMKEGTEADGNEWTSLTEEEEARGRQESRRPNGAFANQLISMARLLLERFCSVESFVYNVHFRNDCVRDEQVRRALQTCDGHEHWKISGVQLIKT